MKNEVESSMIEIQKAKDKKRYYNKLSYWLISFHSGICTLSDLAVQYFFKDVIKLEPGYMSQILSICLIPWMIKPIFGLITDLFPICGYRRKIYIILCGIIDMISWIYMAFFVNTLFQAIVALFIMNAAVAFSTVLGEAIVVELSKLEAGQDQENIENKDHKAKDLISLFFILKDLGILASSYLKGLLVDIMSLRNIFLISAFTPILILIGGFLFVDNKSENEEDYQYEINNNIDNKVIDQYNSNNSKNKFNLKVKINDYNQFNEIENDNNRVDDSNIIKKEEEKKQEILIVKNDNDISKISNHFNSREQSTLNPNKKNFNRLKLFKNLLDFILTKEILIPVLFMIIITSTPSYDDPLFYFLTNELKFSGNIMGQISFVSSVTTIFAVIIYKVFFKHVKFKIIIIIGSLLYFFFSYCAYILVSRINVSWGISDHLMCLFSSSAISMIGEFLSMPLLSLACIKSPKFLEGTVYSFFMSALNLGGIVSYLSGSLLTNFYGITSNDFKKLPKLISLCNILGLLPMFIFFFFNEKYFENNEEEKEKLEEIDEIYKEQNLKNPNNRNYEGIEMNDKGKIEIKQNNDFIEDNIIKEK